MPITTLPVPAAVPRAFSSCTSPKNRRPSGAAPFTSTWAPNCAEAPFAREIVFDSSTLISPSEDEKYTSL